MWILKFQRESSQKGRNNKKKSEPKKPFYIYENGFICGIKNGSNGLRRTQTCQMYSQW